MWNICVFFSCQRIALSSTECQLSALVVKWTMAFTYQPVTWIDRKKKCMTSFPTFSDEWQNTKAIATNVHEYGFFPLSYLYCTKVYTVPCFMGHHNSLISTDYYVFLCRNHFHTGPSGLWQSVCRTRHDERTIHTIQTSKLMPEKVNTCRMNKFIFCFIIHK